MAFTKIGSQTYQTEFIDVQSLILCDMGMPLSLKSSQGIEYFFPTIMEFNTYSRTRLEKMLSSGKEIKIFCNQDKVIAIIGGLII